MVVRTYAGLVVDRSKRLRPIDLAVRYNPLLRGKVCRVIAAANGADADGQRDLTEALTAKVLRWGRQTPYGRHFGNNYAEWPTLLKAQLRDAPSKFISKGVLHTTASTGGTTGTPVALRRSLTNVVAEQAFLDNVLAPVGLTWAKARIAVLRVDTIKSTADLDPPFGIETHGGRRLVLSSPHLSAETLPWFCAKLADFKPDLLWVTPTHAANMLHLLAKAGRPFHIPTVLLTSERLHPDVYAAIEREWGALVIDYYGQAERVSLAASAGPERYFFNAGYGRVELRTSEADKVADGRRQVAIISTGYWNSAMPLIRYDTGDRAIVPGDSSACELEAIALGLKPFFGIAGRDSDFVFAPNGLQIGDVDLFARNVSNLLQLQIVQERLEAITIRAVTRPAFGTADVAKLKANARAILPAMMAIEMEFVDRLEVTAQGKTPFVIRRIAAPRQVPDFDN